MDVDDVVDLSVGPDKEPAAAPASLSMSETTARDFRALTQNANLTITPTTMPAGGTENAFAGRFSLICFYLTV